MQNAPFPSNPTTTVVNEVIDEIFKGAVKMAQVDLAASDPPITANPIIEFIDDQIIEWIANKIYQQFALMVSFEIIDYQVSGEISDSKKALIALKAAQAKGDKDEIAKALADFQKATVALTTFNGAAIPGHL